MERTKTSVKTAPGLRERLARFAPPLILVLAYPYLLKAFHLSVTPDASWFLGAPLLVGVFLVPLLGLLWAYHLNGSEFYTRARQFAYFSIAAPTLFVFVGVTVGLLNLPVGDEVVWAVAWVLLAGILFGRHRTPPAELPALTGKWRFAHGVSAAIILLFVLFHLTNHFMGLVGGAQLHTLVMELGRTVYRIPVIEFTLVVLLLFQVVSGLILVRRWSKRTGDVFRILQIGSGIYLSAFVIGHLNSALISARLIQDIETNWAWATGGANGLIYNAWNIRLVPHYAFGVFFVLSHLSLGLRQVLISHEVNRRIANRICFCWHRNGPHCCRCHYGRFAWCSHLRFQWRRFKHSQIQ